MGYTKVACSSVGTSAKPVAAGGAHNFGRSYYRHYGASGDVRAHYEDLQFTTAGSGGGEVIRARGIVNGLLCAATATINAAHFTGRVEAAKTLAGSGCLNAVRATLEVAGSTPTPGGCLSAIQVDSNIVTGSTISANSSFIRVTNSDAGKLTNLFNLPAAGAASAYLTDLVVANHDTSAPASFDYAIKCYLTGYGNVWIHATKDTPND
jgi:hypothetical protein